MIWREGLDLGTREPRKIFFVHELADFQTPVEAATTGGIFSSGLRKPLRRWSAISPASRYCQCSIAVIRVLFANDRCEQQEQPEERENHHKDRFHFLSLSLELTVRRVKALGKGVENSGFFAQGFRSLSDLCGDHTVAVFEPLHSFPSCTWE